jgi:inner membrane protein
MDDLTHALAGSLIARANPSRKKGLVLACVCGALMPDIDSLLTLFNRYLYITEHRGFTHSWLGFLPVALLAAWVAWLFVRQKPERASFKALFVMALIGVVSNVLLDWVTSWGTMMLWPDRTRFALDHFFIIDLWYLALLTLSLIAGVLFARKRVAISLAGMALLLGYHGLAAYEHHQALMVAVNDRPQGAAIALPEPFSPFRWSAFNRQDGVVRNARLDFLKYPGPLSWREWKEPPVTPEMKAALEDPNIKTYLWFARVPMWEGEKKPDGTFEVRFWDERFRATFGRPGEKTSHHFSVSVVVKDGKVIKSEF